MMRIQNLSALFGLFGCLLLGGCMGDRLSSVKSPERGELQTSKLQYYRQVEIYQVTTQTDEFKSESGQELRVEIANLIQRGAPYTITLFADLKTQFHLPYQYENLRKWGVEKHLIQLKISGNLNGNYVHLTRFKGMLQQRTCKDPTGRYIAGCAVQKNRALSLQTISELEHASFADPKPARFSIPKMQPPKQPSAHAGPQ